MFTAEFKFYLLLPLLLLVAYLRPRWGGRFFGKIERACTWLANRTRLAIVIVGLVAFVAGMVPGLIRMPAPKVHDEFSYLLAADTFAHGRLANPSPAFWDHFETIHTIVRPTYVSKYPPGQGALLSIGVMLGRPILAVWLGLALAAAAVCWALQAWLSPRWAFLGGLLLALHPQMITWGYNYWGGQVTIIGGALLLRGVRRMVDTSREGGWSIGFGLLILANTRPYEGLLISALLIGSGVWLLAWAGRAVVFKTVRQCGPVLALCAVAIFAWFGFYNYRGTGNPLEMPYMVHEREYMVSPIFAGQSLRPEPVYRNPQMRDFYTNVAVDLMGTKKSLRENLSIKIGAQIQGWLWMGLWIPPLLALFWLPLRDRWSRVALLCLGGFSAGLLMGPGSLPQYAAPGVALYMFVMVQGIRKLCLWQRRKGMGLAFVRWLILLCIVTVPVVYGRLLNKNAEGWFRDRERVLAQLEATPGKHLVFMRYSPEHNSTREWVFNGADLENTKVLWSREIDPQSDRQVIEHYGGRSVWVVEADLPNPEPAPYFPQPRSALRVE